MPQGLPKKIQLQSLLTNLALQFGDPPPAGNLVNRPPAPLAPTTPRDGPPTRRQRPRPAQGILAPPDVQHLTPDPQLPRQRLHVRRRLHAPQRLKLELPRISPPFLHPRLHPNGVCAISLSQNWGSFHQMAFARSA